MPWVSGVRTISPAVVKPPSPAPKQARVFALWSNYVFDEVDTDVLHV